MIGIIFFAIEIGFDKLTSPLILAGFIFREQTKSH